MALFERDWLPARSTLSRFLAALTESPVEALRTLFLDDLLSRPLSNEKQPGGLLDRTGGQWLVFDLDGTREAARQRALPKTEGREAKGRWRNWRNNSQVRGELWRILAYKCHLAGVRLAWQRPRGTSHTCPRCGQPADTYRSPEHAAQVQDWGAWLCCAGCGWNGSRDYAAALNIARLGAAFIIHYHHTGRFYHSFIAELANQAVSYRGAAATLRLPSPGPQPRPNHLGKIYCNGWHQSVALRSSYASETMLRLCG